MFDMLDNSRVLQNKEMYKRIMILDRHPYAITEPSNASGRWQTYVKTGDKRRIIRASTYEKLLEKLYEVYFEKETAPVTMQSVFEEWLAYKESITDSMKTIRRHEQHWKKYFSSWSSKRIRSYDRLELQKSCNLLVKENKLSSREWQNVKTILNGMFDYAAEKKYIPSNIMKDVKITVKFRQVNKKTGKTETYQTDEFNAIMRYLDEEYAKTGNIACLAVKLDFFVGFRVGELVALKWCDWIDMKSLHICREEIKDSERIGDKWIESYKVVEHTKTHTDRIIPLVPHAIAILNYIHFNVASNPSDDEYIFVRDGERLTARQINYVLEKACTKLGIPVKRSHKIRKTVASRANAGNVPLDSIRELLGHSNLNTTLGYIYNPLSEKETYQLLSKAL